MSVSSATTAKGRIGHYRAREAGKLTECLVREVGLTSDEVQRLLWFGAVYVDRLRVNSDQLLREDQYIRVHFEPKRFPVYGIDWRASVIYRGEDFVVVNKPPEIPVHATVDNQEENVLRQLNAACGEKFYITQRLDVKASGLIVFARTPEFQRRFNRLLVERKVKKKYRALVAVPPALGRLVHFMEPGERSPKTVKSEPFPNALECALSVLSVSEFGTKFDVEIDLETGRTHQIRAQLSAVGSPILGDVHYGSPTPFQLDGKEFPGIALFSASTSWPDANGQIWNFTGTPPWRNSEGVMECDSFRL